jgi:hypothetical protein
MPFFIATCLVFAGIAQTNHPIQKYLALPMFIYIGLALAVLVIVLTYFKKIPESLNYDIFNVSILFIWYAYWKPLFVDESPIFFFFPIYFALIIAFASLFFVGQKHKIDAFNLKLMQSIVESGVVEPWFIMLCVLISLYFENHFLQFPIMMTLLTMRYTLTECLKQ